MGLNPKILAELAVSPLYEEPIKRTLGPELPELKGTPKQIKWATSIRVEALSACWSVEADALLRSVVDSTWWIANRTDLNVGKYKQPLPHQLLGGQPQADLPAAGEPAYQQPVARRISDAEQWASSVSCKPLLAEASIIAVLSRLYTEPGMRNALRARAQHILDTAPITHADDKDVDAIQRILK